MQQWNVNSSANYFQTWMTMHLDYKHPMKRVSTQRADIKVAKEIKKLLFPIARLWMGCAIFCRRKDTKSYYTPRLDLNDLGVDPYFPDGTWCHHDGKMNHYCLQHHCLPEVVSQIQIKLKNKRKNLKLKYFSEFQIRKGHSYEWRCAPSTKRSTKNSTTDGRNSSVFKHRLQ